jgi:Holliday junction resolvase RusA-like endonuclease
MDEAALQIIAQRVGHVKGPVTLEFAVEENKRRDLGNYEKIVTDALVRYGVIEGDRCKTVRGILLRWSSNVKGIQVFIEQAV